MSDIRADVDKMIESGDLEGLLTRTGEFHGHHCVGSALGVMAAYRAMKKLDVKDTSGMEHVLAIVETNNCFSDGVQVVTGCTFGNNALIYRDYGKTGFTLLKRNGEGIRVVTRPDLGEKLKNDDPEAAELFHKVMIERNASPKEEERLMELNKNHCYNILSIAAEEIFKTERIEVEPPAKYSKILGNCFCSRCGEKVMETKTFIENNETLCVPCAGTEYNQLDWEGITVRRK